MISDKIDYWIFIGWIKTFKCCILDVSQQSGYDVSVEQFCEGIVYNSVKGGLDPAKIGETISRQ